MTKTALVEWAVDRLPAESQMLRAPSSMARLLTQLDAIPDRPDADDPMLWDDIGLPR